GGGGGGGGGGAVEGSRVSPGSGGGTLAARSGRRTLIGTRSAGASAGPGTTRGPSAGAGGVIVSPAARTRCPTAALSTGPEAATVRPVAGNHPGPHTSAAADATATASCSASWYRRRGSRSSARAVTSARGSGTCGR